MVIFFGLHVPGSTPVGKALLLVPGIGRSYAGFLCNFFGVSFFAPLQDLPREIIKNLIRKTTQERLTSTALKREVTNAIRLKSQLRLYQGIRHVEGLPVRGQNTKTNASTSRRLQFLSSPIKK
jgi:small subunit ribosomal protein S13